MYSQDKEQIRRVFEETYAHNVKTRNLNGYGEMYTKDALWIAPDADDRRGIADIIKGFAQSIAKQDIVPVFTADEIEVMGDFGYVIGTSKASIRPHDGSAEKKVTFRALWLMKKDAGIWKIDRQIWNKKP